MFKVRMILFLCLIMAFAINAATIIGTVQDAETGGALPGANVYPLDIKGIGASTDMDGNFRMLNVPRGKLQIIATYRGYQKRVADVKIESENDEIEVNFKLEPSADMLDKIVVTATRERRILKEVPIRTEVVTNEQLRERSITDLYEALDGVQGVRVEQQCSNCNFSELRLNGLGGGYAKTVIDGMPIFSGLASVYGMQQLQASNIEQIEIVKGAGSALYGGDALGGVINVIMKEPGFRPSTRFGFNVSEHGDYNLNFSGTMRSDNYAVAYSFQHDIENELDQTGNIEDNFVEMENFDNIGEDGYTDRIFSTNTGGGLKAYLYEPFGTGSKITAYGRAMTEFRKGGYIETFSDPFDPDAEHIKTDRYEFGTGYNHYFQNGNDIDINLSYTKHYRNATNGAAWDKAIDAGILDDDLELTEDGQNYIDEYGFNRFKSQYYPKPFISDEDLYLIDMKYNQPIMPWMDVMVGGQYRKSDLVQDINGDENADEKHADDIGIFIQSSMKLMENRTELILGGRVDIHGSEDKLAEDVALESGESYEPYESSVFNPRIAAIYNISDFAIARASFGTGYRVPYLFAEDLHLCASSPKIYKGSDLEPEKSSSISAGLDFDIPYNEFGFNAFHNQIKDKVEFIDPDGGEVPEGYDFRWTNAGNATTTGIELYANGRPLSYLEYAIDFGYTLAKYEERRYGEDIPGHEDSDFIPRAPALTGGLGLTFDTKIGLSLIMQAKYTGKMYIDHVPEEDEALLRLEETEPYTIFNTHLAYNITPYTNIYLDIKNLTDYVQPTRDITDAAYIYAPLYGRTISIGFDIEL